MDALWKSFKTVYPYSPSQFGGRGLLDDEAMLKQPLMSYDDDPEAQPQTDSDEEEKDEERDYYRQQYEQPWSPWTNTKPDRLSSQMTKMQSYSSSSMAYSVVAAPAAAVDATPSYSYRSGQSASFASAKTRRKAETMEDISQRALARIATLTMAMGMVLILTVAAHAS